MRKILYREPSRKNLIKDCDDLLRLIIRLRDKVCQRTLRQNNLQVVHYYTRRNLRLRWDFDNVCLLNAGVHKWWAHVHIEEFREWWKERLGEEKFQQLIVRGRCKGSLKVHEIKVVKEWLKQELKQLQRKEQQ